MHFILVLINIRHSALIASRIFCWRQFWRQLSYERADVKHISNDDQPALCAFFAAFPKMCFDARLFSTKNTEKKAGYGKRTSALRAFYTTTHALCAHARMRVHALLPPSERTESVHFWHRIQSLQACCCCWCWCFFLRCCQWQTCRTPELTCKLVQDGRPNWAALHREDRPTGG